MCGLAGFVGEGPDHVLREMVGTIAHRGPDGEGCWSRDGVHLGHRLLSIIDRAGGDQPMWDAASEIGVVYNGEIYNHADLRRDLQARGHVFRTSHCDTEVLIHGWREWGADLPVRLNGMFAFAVFDRRARSLFIARDRFGEKPFYYAATPRAFVFGSEASALLAHPAVSRELSVRAAQKYMAWGYLPEPHSIYRDVAKLPAGHSLTLDVDTLAFRIAPYWRFTLEPDESLVLADEARLADELRALIVQATRRRLVSDVPLGLFLSGGLDSSAILAGAAQTGPASPLKTFTIGFTDPSFDESAHARSVAAAFGAEHSEQILDAVAAANLLPRVLNRLDEPLADPSILPTWLLSRFTRQSVTVALSGDGGDELFAGYDPFRALTPSAIYARLMPRGLHKGLRRLAELLPRSTRNMSFDFKVRRALGGLSWPPPLWNPVWMAPADPDLIGEIFAAPLSADALYEEAIDLWDRGSGRTTIDRTLEFYTRFYLPNDILTKVDRATMLNSLESRAVFLDNDLVDFCRRLPHRFKYRDGQRKVLLRRAVSGWLTPQILNRPKKGFGMPVARWLRDWEAPSVDAASAAAIGLDAPALDRRWAAHRAGERDDRLLLFAWASLAPHLMQNAA